MIPDHPESRAIAQKIQELCAQLSSTKDFHLLEALLPEVQALTRLNERLELLIESAELAWWDQDFADRTVQRSRKWAEMLGFSEEEIGAELAAWHERIHPDDLKATDEASTRSKSGQSPCYEVEHRLRNKAGEWVWIRNWGKIVERDGAGTPLRAVGFHQDISVRKQAELDREELLGRLERTLNELKRLRGIIPICSSCKKIRDDKGSWRQIESYIKEHSEAEFSHGMCPECTETFYQELEQERGE